MIQLGDRVRDSITGFTGIATGRAEYQYGCKQIFVTPERLKDDGSMPGGEWFDEQRLNVKSDVKSGGPQPSPPERNHPPARRG